MSFLTIPFRFSGSNFRPNDILSGAPSLNSFSGMSHNVQRVARLDLGIDTFLSSSFTVVFFSVDVDSATIKRPADSRKMENQSLNDFRRGHGEAALVVNFSVENDDDFTAFSNSIKDGTLFLALSAELRFAGGEIFIGTDGEFGVSPLNIFVEDDWAKVIKRLMKSYPTQGQIWEDKKALLSQYALQEGLPILDAMLGLLQLSNKQQSIDTTEKSESTAVAVDKTDVAAFKTADGNDSTEETDLEESFDIDDLLSEDSSFELSHIEATQEILKDQYLGILLPVSNGYHEIGHARNGQYFGESILSLVRSRVLSSLLRALSDGSETWERHFWKQQYLPKQKIHRSVSVYE